MDIGEEKLIWMYTTMVRHREFEERVTKEFAAGHIPGGVHLSQGQEAIAAGVCINLRQDDYLTTTHRCHGHLIAKGARTDKMMAEIYGKRTGLNKGKAGSQHLADFGVGVLGAEGIQGTPLLIATGAALSARFRGTDQVAVSFIGDGTLNTGSFHEGLNMATAWKLPLVCICENNMWACSTRIYDVTNLTELSDRAVGYGIPGVAIDGNDVLAVYEAAVAAVTRARIGYGPTLLECRTCRLRAHYEGDSQAYRSNVEIDDCRKKDPIPRFRSQLLEMKLLTEEEANKIHQEALVEMDKAVAFAEQSPFPDPEEIFTDV